MNPKRPQLVGQCRSDDARCDSHRCLPGWPGWGHGAPGFPPPGAARTYLALGRQRPKRDAIRAVAAPVVCRQVSV